MRNIIDRLAEPRNLQRLIVGFLALVVVAVALGGITLVLIERVAARNTLAIRVSCTLTSNLIIEAGAGGQRNDSAAGRAYAELTAIRLRGIARNLTAQEKARSAQLAAIVKRAGGIVSTPDCDEIAKHPEGVKDLIRRKTRPRGGS